jgi:hypothetical protein
VAAIAPNAAGRVVLFGGYSGGFLRDTWKWTDTSWSRAKA